MVEQLKPCRNCDGCGWVCENHRDTPWSGLVETDAPCCGGAGAPCPVCGPEMACAGYVHPLLEGVIEAHLTFLHYAELHESKGTAEGNLKGKRNRDLAEKFAKLIAKARGLGGEV